MRRCLEDEELFALVDGALSEKDERPIREHLEACVHCKEGVARIKGALACLSKEEPIDMAAHVDVVMAAIERAPSSVARPPRTTRVLPVALGALAAAAALVLGVGIGRHSPESEFTARGGAAVDAGLRRTVALTVQVLDGEVARPVVRGTVVTRKTRFLASHRNTSVVAAQAMVFAVDSKNTVHWLYPAYDSASADPPSVALVGTGGSEVMMSSAVSFEDLSSGPLTLFTVLSREPLRVSRIERMRDLSLAALRRELSEADISSIDVVVADE